MNKLKLHDSEDLRRARMQLSKLVKFVEEKTIEYPEVDGDIYRILHPVVELIFEKISKIYAVCYEYKDSILPDFMKKVNENVQVFNFLNSGNASDFLRLGFALLTEYDFLLGKEGETEVGMVLFEARRAIREGGKEQFADLSLIAYSYPYMVVKKFLHGAEVQEMLGMPSKIEAARRDAGSIQAESGKMAVLFGEMKTLWEDIKQHYHNAVLVEGFSQMRADKLKEKEDAVRSTFWLGVVMVVLPLIQVSIFLLFGDTNFAKTYAEKILFIAPPVVAMELLIFYFFRIALSHNRSITAQILQLDLRIALSQFVKGYQDYNKRLSDNERKGLEKFESMIFSGIAPNDGGIPTTFDGISEIAKLIEAIKK